MLNHNNLTKNNMFKLFGECTLHSIHKLTYTLIFIIVAIFIGESFHDIQRASMLSGQLVTIVSLIIGPKILWTAYKQKQLVLGLTVISIWIANIAFSLQLALEPIEDMLFDVATFATMIALLKYSSEIVDPKTRKVYRRKSDADNKIICDKCGSKIG